MTSLSNAVLVWCAGLTPSVVAVPRKDFRVDDNGDGNGPQITVWNTAKLGTKPTAEQLAAVTQQQVDTYYTALGRALALSLTTDAAGPYKLQRARDLATLDAINVLREWDVFFQAAVAAATSLADLKARVALLPLLSDITVAAAKAAVVSKINSGAAD